jgi:cytochrome P450
MKTKVQKRLKRVISQATRLKQRLFSPFRGQPVFSFGGAEVFQPHVLKSLWRLAPFYETVEQGSGYVEAKSGWAPIRFMRDHQPFPEVSRFEKFLVPSILTQLGLFEVYRACGVTPGAVVGMSLGEGAALYAAEALSLQDVMGPLLVGMAKIVASKPGRTFQISTLAPELEAGLKAQSAHLIMDRGSSQIWGAEDEHVEVVRAWFHENQISHQELYEFLPHVPIYSKQTVADELSGWRPRPPRYPLYLGALGGRMFNAPDVDYVWKLVGQTAQFSQTLHRVIKDGYRLILDMGAGAYYEMLQANLPKLNKSIYVLAGLNTHDVLTPFPPATEKILAESGFRLTAALNRFKTPEVDLFSAQFLRDPSAYYRRWRQSGAAHYLPDQKSWLILNYDDIAAILKDPEHYSSAPYRTFSTLLSGNDPPDHTRVRQGLAPYFTRPRLLAYADRVERHTRQFIDAIRPLKSFDLMEAFTKPLPYAITCDFLGVKYEEVDSFRAQLAQSPSWDLFKAGLTGGGLMAELMEAAYFNEAETISICEFMIGAGVITVKDFICNSVYALLKRPDWMKTARAHPEQVPALLEELFRLEPPVLTLLRQTRTEVEIGGVKIPSNKLLYLGIGAANRDPSKFTSPDELILNRTGAKHLSFSVGPHYCLGVHLGRLECEVILRLLLTEWPPLRIEQPLEMVEFTGSPHVREIRSLQVGFER